MTHSTRFSRSALVLGAGLMMACGPSLGSAIAENDAHAVEKLLASGADPNAHSPDQQPPLCTAIRKDVALVEMLLRAGAKPDTPCGGVLPTEIAVSRHDAASLKLLLERGANPFLRGEKATAPLLSILAKTGKPDTKNIAALVLDHVEAKYGADKARAMARGEKIEKRAPGQYPEHEYPEPLAAASFYCNADLVRTLVARGADAKGHYGLTGLLHYQQVWPITFISRAGNFRARDSKACQPTSTALVELGAEWDAKSIDGKTWEEERALWIAAERAWKADEDEWQRIQADSRADAERREAEGARQNWQRFQQIVSDTSGPNPANPVDDNSFQERMRRIASEKSNAAPRPAPTPSSPTPSSPAPSSPTPSSPTPSSPAPSSPAPSSPAPASGGEMVKAGPIKPAELKCETVVVKARAFGQSYTTRAEAEERVRADARRRCLHGGGFSLADEKCEETKWVQGKEAGGKIQRTGERTYYQCSATFTCEQPKEHCRGGTDSSAATKQ